MLKQPFVIYADFESLTEKHTCSYGSYGYKLVCCYDDKYSKPVKIYRGENACYKFLVDMPAEVKYCKKVMRKHFTKQLKMTKKIKKNFNKVQYAIFVKKNLRRMMKRCEIIVIFPENREALLTIFVICN